jgi:hypothetical protein
MIRAATALTLAIALCVSIVGMAGPARAAPYQNTVSNPGFEASFSGWSAYANSAKVSRGIVAAGAQSGVRCSYTRISATTNSGAYGNIYTASTIKVDASENYYVRAFNKRAANANSSGVTSSIIALCYDSAGSVIKAITVWSGAGNGIWSARGRVVTSQEFPATTTGILIELRTRGAMAKGSICDYWDSVWVGQEPQAPTIGWVSVSQGYAGDTVTVYGSHFYSPTSVCFGSAPSTKVTWYSPGRISAVVPDVTSSDLVVDNGYGTATTPFSALPVVLPRMDSVSPAAASPGMLVTITGVDFGSDRQSTMSVHLAVRDQYFVNDQMVSPQDWSDTQITFLVPTRATGTAGSGLYGDGTLTVVNDHGNSNSMAFSVVQSGP